MRVRFKNLSVPVLFALFLIGSGSTCPLMQPCAPGDQRAQCKATDSFGDAIKSVERAINLIETKSERLEIVLANLKGDLINYNLPQAAGFVEQTISRAIATTGSEFRCDADFMVFRLKQNLTNLINKLRQKNANDTIPDELGPVYCNVTPSSVSLVNSPNRIDFYGYDFDKFGGTRVYLVKTDGSETDVTQYIDITTHYHMSLNTSNNGVYIDKSSQRITLKNAGKVLGSIASLDDCPTPSAGTYTKEVTQTRYSESFTCGDSMLTGCSRDHSISKTCSAGFQKKGNPQATESGEKGDGWCAASWTSNSPTDCSAKIHLGLKNGTFQGYVTCQLAVEEYRPSEYIAPNPPGGWCGRAGSGSSSPQASLYWSSAGPISGKVCVQLKEPSDPHTWDDNYLCSDTDIGLKWSNAGPASNMKCTKLSEPSDPNTWHDNYLCLPNSSTLTLSWSSAGPIAGKSCVQLNEPADPHTWNDNYICY